MITIRAHPNGSILSVRAQPGARKTAILGEHGEALKVAVTAPPEDGKANEAIAELLRHWLDLRRSQIELLNGKTSRNKQFLIVGCDPEQLNERIDERLKSR